MHIIVISSWMTLSQKWASYLSSSPKFSSTLFLIQEALNVLKWDSVFRVYRSIFTFLQQVLTEWLCVSLDGRDNWLNWFRPRSVANYLPPLHNFAVSSMQLIESVCKTTGPLANPTDPCTSFSKTTLSLFFVTALLMIGISSFDKLLSCQELT